MVNKLYITLSGYLLRCKAIALDQLRKLSNGERIEIIAIIITFYAVICATAENKYNNRANFIANVALKAVDYIKEENDPTSAQYVQQLEIIPVPPVWKFWKMIGYEPFETNSSEIEIRIENDNIYCAEYLKDKKQTSQKFSYDTEWMKVYEECNRHAPSIDFIKQSIIGRRKKLNDKNLAELWLHKAKLEDIHFEKANLEKAHFERANLKEAHFEGAILRYAHFEGANLEKAHFEKADLGVAHFEGTYLFGTNFEGADLFLAHFEGTDLRWTDFKNACLGGVHFERADLSGAHFEGAIVTMFAMKEGDTAILCKITLEDVLLNSKYSNDMKPLPNFKDVKNLDEATFHTNKEIDKKMKDKIKELQESGFWGR